MLSAIGVAVLAALLGLPHIEWAVLGLSLVFAAAVLALAGGGKPGVPRAPPPQPESPYEILEAVGSGQMGTVFKARHRRLGRLVAIKSINPGNVDREDTARFEREARALAELHSPHTVKIHDFG